MPLFASVVSYLIASRYGVSGPPGPTDPVTLPRGLRDAVDGGSTGTGVVVKPVDQLLPATTPPTGRRGVDVTECENDLLEHTRTPAVCLELHPIVESVTIRID